VVSAAEVAERVVPAETLDPFAIPISYALLVRAVTASVAF
jgi:hypothetical protein